jgi:hypothetical protein
MLIEGLLVEHGVLSPHTGQYLMRRKAEPLPEVVTQTEQTQPVTADALR